MIMIIIIISSLVIITIVTILIITRLLIIIITIIIIVNHIISMTIIIIIIIIIVNNIISMTIIIVIIIVIISDHRRRDHRRSQAGVITQLVEWAGGQLMLEVSLLTMSNMSLMWSEASSPQFSFGSAKRVQYTLVLTSECSPSTAKFAKKKNSRPA